MDRFDNFRFNEKHYTKVLGKRKNDNEYCFALNKELGRNGLIEDHPLTGRFVERTKVDSYNSDNKKGKRSIIESVHCHYYNGGYYIVLLCRDVNNSHGQLWWANVNSTEKILLEGIEDAHNNFKLLPKSVKSFE